MTQNQKVEQWLKERGICGKKEWWDEQKYYSLRIDQIIAISRYINKNKNK